MYFVGPLTVSKEGFQYLLTIIDWTSRWLKATPLASMDTTPAWRPSSATGW